jgi:hypothetical protein
MWKSLAGLSILTLVALPSLALPALSQLRFGGTDGTIVGRVFIDRNGDGEKQAHEPGIPNAVILMDDGLQVKTDEYGRFTVGSVLPGYRTGVLDLRSIPGYRIAPNAYVSERNSPSRLVRVAPGSLVRMNFGVVPAASRRQPI